MLFVPEIFHNLISVGQLLEKGYSLHFHDKICNVSDKDGKLLISVMMFDRSFALKPAKYELVVCTAVSNRTLVKTLRGLYLTV